MKHLLSLIAIFACGPARADYPVHFIKATCVPEMDYFEISISDANNPHHLYTDGKLTKSTADSLLKKGIVILLEPGELHCALKGLDITVKNEPYESGEHNLFPGSKVSLTIEDHTYAKSVDLFAGWMQTFLTKIIVNGDGYGNEHGYVYYTAKQSDDGPEFFIYQPFPSKSTVTNATLRAYDGKQGTLYPQEDGSIR